MRYIINDDDLEDWLKKLIEASRYVQYGHSNGEDIIYMHLEYVIGQMRNELKQHFSEESIEKFFPLDNQ